MSGDAREQVEERMRELLLGGDLEALASYVDGLDAAASKVARAWATRARRADTWNAHRRSIYDSGLEQDEMYRRADVMDVGHVLLIGHFEAPAAAVKSISRFRLAGRIDPYLAYLRGRLERRGDEWARAFCVAADTLSPGAQGAWVVARFVAHFVAAHDLPVPTGALFHSSAFTAVFGSDPETSLTSLVRVHPLLPEVVTAHLASGQAYRHPGLPATIATLVDEGWLDRDRVVAEALQQLTAGHRVGSQRVLVGTLERLGLTAGEVTGGIPFLLGALSAADRSVAKVLLPLAIELVVTPDDLEDLVRVVAGRPEKGLRQTLAKALAPRHLGQRLDTAALVAAIDQLADQETDQGMRAAYEKARLRLGAAPQQAEPVEVTALGLWDLEPALMDEEASTHHMREFSWRALRSGAEKPDGDFHDRLLDLLGRGRMTELDLLARAYELAAEDMLSATRAADLFEALFVGGAMRRTWTVALRVADLCAGPPRPAAGLDKLLRVLATYAVEVPEPSLLPRQLLALMRGSSKAALEARHLAEVLGSPSDRPAPEPVHLGLWREVTEPLPWRLAYSPTRDLKTLARRLDGGFGEISTVGRTTLESIAFDDTLGLIAEHGAEMVRRELATPYRHSGPVPQALQLWAAGLLTTETYWRIATTAVPVSEVRETWREELGAREASHQEYRWTVIDGVSMDPPVMPDWWHSSPRQRIQFLHACEAVLVREHGGLLLSTPDVSDGSLGLTTLLDRLQRASLVGPIDLRLALGRLRPTTPQDAGRVAPGPTTDPALTTPRGDRSVVADEVVRRWLGEGGLRLVAKERPHPGYWSFDALAPVPWRSCEALVGGTVLDGPSHFRGDDVWLLPGRPELASINPHHPVNVADVGGDLDVTVWDGILGWLGTHTMNMTDWSYTQLTHLQNQGRLDPSTAVAAATMLWDGAQPHVLRDVLSWERALLRGSMRGLWPVAVAIVEAGLARRERPVGLDALIAVLRRWAHEVPADQVPAWLSGS
ncbi:hypothetical protein J2X46_004498 [Nocardioides sp. BE266]|uniref:hypothetical protein n=1 Tax=Nocardioides sp. BE266 TaxID=2817725 RepID=UPI002860254F|nr:hypothetical protein [Nocardioides sp. BE266]MDR7255491.1 hypothetical protein [Nocardioides sp. BE266]